MNIDPEAIQAFIEALVALIESCQEPEPEVAQALYQPSRVQKLGFVLRVRGSGLRLRERMAALNQLHAENITSLEDAQELIVVVKEAA